MLFRIKTQAIPITANVRILFLIILLSSENSALIWRTQWACWSLSGQIFYPQWGLPSLCLSCTFFLHLASQLTPVLVNDFASDVTEKVGLTDEQSPTPCHKFHTTRVCSILFSSFFFFFLEEGVLSPLKNASVYISKSSQGSWSLNYQLLFLHVYLPEFSTGSLLSANRYALVSLNLKQTVGNSEMQVPFHREIIVWWQLGNLISFIFRSEL